MLGGREKNRPLVALSLRPGFNVNASDSERAAPVSCKLLDHQASGSGLSRKEIVSSTLDFRQIGEKTEVLVACDRQVDHHGGAFVDRGFHFDMAAMAFDD